jgi:hypothetical protein
LEWRKSDSDGNVLDLSQDTKDLVQLALSAEEDHGTRENIQFWIDIRNAVAHRCLPSLDVRVIPHAQAGLLNYERVLVDNFGENYQLAQRLSVPLQLSGFRDPEVLTARKLAQSSLPLDVQALLSRAEETTPELLADETFMMRVAFVPVVLGSNNNADAVAYFVRPGEVPTDLQESIEKYVVLPKPARGPRPHLGAQKVVDAVRERIPFKFTTTHHAAAARHFGLRPPKGEPEQALDELFCDYISAAKIYVYNDRWVKRLVKELATEDGFRTATGADPVLKDEAV